MDDWLKEGVGGTCQKGSLYRKVVGRPRHRGSRLLAPVVSEKVGEVQPGSAGPAAAVPELKVLEKLMKVILAAARAAVAKTLCSFTSVSSHCSIIYPALKLSLLNRSV